MCNRLHKTIYGIFIGLVVNSFRFKTEKPTDKLNGLTYATVNICGFTLCQEKKNAFHKPKRTQTNFLTQRYRIQQKEGGGKLTCLPNIAGDEDFTTHCCQSAVIVLYRLGTQQGGKVYNTTAQWIDYKIAVVVGVCYYG